ncbi:endolytic transglycosylase MltG [uncultured Mitsuokella sp.]|uniref:endolytic transglycosylase MltG n=1 Tax=uncultured Mitsuokella sp. TaxID=453120 RepID=UPI00259448DB|nr:endolytic transglycosylase MltG [uncultured Mitsuokella sp.]
MHGNKKERAPKQAPQPAETVKQQEKAAEQPADKAEAAVLEGKPQDNPAAKESTKKAAVAESAEQPDNPDGSKEEGATTPEASKVAETGTAESPAAKPAKTSKGEKQQKTEQSETAEKAEKPEAGGKASAAAETPAPSEPSENHKPSDVLEPSAREKLRAALGRLGWKKWAAIAAVFAVLLGAGLFLAFGTTHVIERSDRDAKENIYMVVKPGTTASEISDHLTRLGVIDSRLRFWWLMKLQGDAQKFKTGTYAFAPHMDEQAVLDKLVSGDTTVVRFTIPEGFGIKEIAKRLADEGLVDEQEFLAEAKDFAPYDYMKKRPNERYAAEGYLFPDTYEIHSEVTPEAIMKMMAEDFDTRLTPALRQQAAAKNLSIHDLITLASLVEKEARYDEDRPIIAQVFFKRLQMGMPLQSDTTLQYLMAGPKEDVSIEDTKIDSPYNTYQHAGLPPGPIASPGMKSILAVLNPASTDYLYFVADRQGHNHYSQTYDEHLAIVEQVR